MGRTPPACDGAVRRRRALAHPEFSAVAERSVQQHAAPPQLVAALANISQGERFYVSYARDAFNQPNGVNPPSLPSSRGGLYDQYGMVAAATLVSTLRPNLVSELRAGVTRTTIDFLPAWSLYGTSVLPSIGGQPYVLASGLVSNPYNPASSSDPQARLAPLYQVGEKMSWLKGIHNIKAGFDVRFVSVHEYLSFNVMPRVILGTGNVATQNIRTIDGIGPNGATADSLLATLTGSVASITQMFYAPPGRNPQFTAGAYNRRTYRQRELAGFLQDDVRLRRNLLEVGAGSQHCAGFGPALRIELLARFGGSVAAVAHVATLGGGHRILRLPGLVIDVAERGKAAIALDLLQRVGQRLAVPRLRERVVGVEPKHDHGRNQQRDAQQEVLRQSHESQKTSPSPQPL